MITKLTEEQEARFPEFVERWVKVGRSTAPTDRARAEAAIPLIYGAADLPPPEKIYWARSPLEGLRLLARLCLESQQKVVSAASLQAECREKLYSVCYGNHDAGWLSLYSYFVEVCNIEGEKLRGLLEMAEAAGWFFPMDKIVVCTDRPIALHLDEEGRLHSETGMAISYADGFGLYSYHGVTVPSDIITDRSSITVERIEREANAELRRIMMEIYGLGQFVVDSGAVEIQSDARGRLFHREARGSETEPLRAVLVDNSTLEPDGSRKKYFLRVPPTTQTAAEGVAWTFRKTAADYCPEMET